MKIAAVNDVYIMDVFTTGATTDVRSRPRELRSN